MTPQQKDKQETILKFISLKLEETGYSPTHQEISEHLNVSSAPYHIRHLENNGLLSVNQGWRSFMPTLEGLQSIGQGQDTYDRIEKNGSCTHEYCRLNPAAPPA